MILHVHETPFAGNPSRYLLILGCIWSAMMAVYLARKMSNLYAPLLLAVALWSLIFANGMMALARGAVPFGRFSVAALNSASFLSLAGWATFCLLVYRNGRLR